MVSYIFIHGNVFLKLPLNKKIVPQSKIPENIFNTCVAIFSKMEGKFTKLYALVKLEQIACDTIHDIDDILGSPNISGNQLAEILLNSDFELV